MERDAVAVRMLCVHIVCGCVLRRPLAAHPGLSHPAALSCTGTANSVARYSSLSSHHLGCHPHPSPCPGLSCWNAASVALRAALTWPCDVDKSSWLSSATSSDDWMTRGRVLDAPHEAGPCTWCRKTTRVMDRASQSAQCASAATTPLQHHCIATSAAPARSKPGQGRHNIYLPAHRHRLRVTPPSPRAARGPAASPPPPRARCCWPAPTPPAPSRVLPPSPQRSAPAAPLARPPPPSRASAPPAPRRALPPRAGTACDRHRVVTRLHRLPSFAHCANRATQLAPWRRALLLVLLRQQGNTTMWPQDRTVWLWQHGVVMRPQGNTATQPHGSGTLENFGARTTASHCTRSRSHAGGSLCSLTSMTM